MAVDKFVRYYQYYYYYKLLQKWNLRKLKHMESSVFV